jgi:uncharacterized protein YjiS (DUF1127 family)
LDIPANAGERIEMLTSLIRYVRKWREYGAAIRELSSLNDRELADIGITRSDIPHVALEQVRN